MIDDSWWTGVVLERAPAPPTGPGAGPSPAPAAPVAPAPGPAWAVEAASHFLSLRVRWDNGEVERLSPWDLEPIDPERYVGRPLASDVAQLLFIAMTDIVT